MSEKISGFSLKLVLAKYIRTVLELELKRTADGSPVRGFENEDEYLSILEGLMYLKFLLYDSQSRLSYLLMSDPTVYKDATLADGHLSDMHTGIDSLRLRLQTIMKERIAESRKGSGYLPRIERLADKLSLATKERCALQYIVLHNIGIHFPFCSGRESSLRGVLRNMALAGDMSSREVLDFLSPSRRHMSEGLFEQTDDTYSFEFSTVSFKMTKDVLSALMGGTLSAEQFLSVENTTLGQVLREEGITSHSLPKEVNSPKGDTSATGRLLSDDFDFGSEIGGGLDVNDIISKLKSAESRALAGASSVVSASAIGSGVTVTKKKSADEDKDGANGVGVVVADELKKKASISGALEPFSSDLDYLEENFKLVEARVKLFTAVLEDEKDAFLFTGKTKKTSKREYTAQVKQALRRTEVRLKLTLAKARSEELKAGCGWIPRLERLCQARKLCDFEKLILITLTGATLSVSVIKALSQKSSFVDSIKVGDMLAYHLPDLTSQVAHRKYFHKGAALVKDHLIDVEQARYVRSDDLMMCDVSIDRRMVDFIVGLDTEIGALVEGSRLYTPQVKLEDVVLPSAKKDAILNTIDGWRELNRARKELGITLSTVTPRADEKDKVRKEEEKKSESKDVGMKERMDDGSVIGEELAADSCSAPKSASASGFALSSPTKEGSLTELSSVGGSITTTGETSYYGNGTVILFHGMSGTGKTMMAHAVADYLSCKILLVNIAWLSADKLESVMAVVFREAKIENAVVFFDECETLFESRERKSNAAVNMALNMIERFPGLILLATNRSFDLDEAMHRRIGLSVEFNAPSVHCRELIWKKHVPETGQLGAVLLDDCVDFPALSVRFELTGGFIKNSMQSALKMAALRRRKKIDAAEMERKKAAEVLGESLKEEVVEASASAVAAESGSEEVCGCVGVESDESKKVPIVISQRDLVFACKEQIIGQLELHGFNRRTIPQKSLEDLVLTTKVRRIVKSVSLKHKASQILTSQWGFEQRGMCILVSGLHSTGKSTIAEAIAYECGRPLKIITSGELMHVTRSKSQQATESMFSDLNTGAVMVIEGSESLFGGSPFTGNNTLISYLLHNIRRHKTIFVFVLQGEVHSGKVIALNPAQKALFREFDFVVSLEKPNHEMRKKMWKELIPDKTPVDAGIDYKHLATKHQRFVVGDIKKVVEAACARACIRKDADRRKLTMDDLKTAAQKYEDDMESHGLMSRTMAMYC